MWWWKKPNARKSEPRISNLVREADILRDNGNPKEAAKRYAQALERMPNRYDLRVQLGNMSKDSGQFAEAEMAYRAAIDLRPDDADVHVQLGHLLEMTGRRTEALTAYRRALELNPLESAAVMALADAGDPHQLERRFEVQLRAGGTDTLLAISEMLQSIRSTLDRLSAQLPDALAQTALPIACYDTFRNIFPVPIPPPSASLHFHILLLADREAVATLFTQIKGIREQSAQDWTLTVIGNDAARRSVVELCTVSEPRIALFTADPALHEA
jgi:tetratricopeptide (TPR) repeat protein